MVSLFTVIGKGKCCRIVIECETKQSWWDLTKKLLEGVVDSLVIFFLKGLINFPSAYQGGVVDLENLAAKNVDYIKFSIFILPKC